MTVHVSKKFIIEVMLFLYFFLAFCVFPASVPYRGPIMTTLVVISYLLQVSVQRIAIWRSSSLKYLYCIIIVNALSNLYASSDIVVHMVYMIQYCCMLSAVGMYCNDERSTIRLMKIVFWTAFIGGPIIGLVQLLQGRYMFGQESNLNVLMKTVISDARHDNSNYAALVMYLCITLGGVIYNRTRNRICLIATLISIIGLVLTFSRTAITVFSVSILCYAVYNLQRQHGFKYHMTAKTIYTFTIFIGLIAIFADGIAQLATNYLRNADLENLLRFKQSTTSTMRTNQWIASMEVITKGDITQFLIGYGDNARVKLGERTGFEMSAHNFIFGQLAEDGIIGAICALMIYYRSLKNGWRLYRANPWACWLVMGSVGILACYMMISILTWELMLAILFIEIAYRNAFKAGFFSENRDTRNVHCQNVAPQIY